MRTRHQDGWVEERGSRHKIWYGHYFTYMADESGKETRRHIGVKLGEKAKLRKWEAETRLRKIIASATKAQPKPNSLTLDWFTRERFLPMRSAQWAPSTRETNLYTVERHVLPALGSKALCELEKFHCQLFLNGLAEKGFSFTVVDHCRTMLKAILEEALDADLVGKNPARKLVNPETKESEKHVLPKSQARLLIESLTLRDRLIAMIAAFCAMRPGEIFGLQWSSWRGENFHVEGTAWRGTLRPGKAKTKGSKAPVAIPDMLSPLLTTWLEEHGPEPVGLMFASEKGTPMRPENWLRPESNRWRTQSEFQYPLIFRCCVARLPRMRRATGTRRTFRPTCGTPTSRPRSGYTPSRSTRLSASL
jgi:integrase